MDDRDIVQKFFTTQCYQWMRQTVKRMTVRILDATVYIFFYILGTFLLCYFLLGFKVPIGIAYYLLSHPIPTINAIRTTINGMGIVETLVVTFVFLSPIFSATVIWIKLHEHDE